jgi:hypothetical protein
MIDFSQQNMLYRDRNSNGSIPRIKQFDQRDDIKSAEVLWPCFNRNNLKRAVFAQPPLLAIPLPWRAADGSGFFAIGAGFSAGAFCLGAEFALNALFIDAFKSASYEGGLSSEFKTVSTFLFATGSICCRTSPWALAAEATPTADRGGFSNGPIIGQLYQGCKILLPIILPT